MAKFLPYEGNIPFQGRGNLFTRGIQQSLLKRSQIRIHIKNMGWDAAYTRLVSMPTTVRTGLKGALKENAELIESLAKYYVPHGLETDRLQDSIEAVPVGGPNSLAYTVKADTPYAHFVEMDVHPSYGAGNKTRTNLGGTVFGARQGPPQGPHYMQRATEASAQSSHDTVRDAFNKAMVVAMGIAKRGHKAGLDFDTRVGARAFAFVKSGMAIGLDAPISAGSGGSDIHPLDMALGGL
jgi:hypothetical protein